MLKPILEFPDYFASDEGEIYSMKAWGGYCGSSTKKPSTPRLLKKTKRRNRFFVCLCMNGEHFYRNVSTLVLCAFVSTRPKGMLVCHGIRGSLVDTPDNLYWGTPSRNLGADRLRDGTMPNGEKCALHKLNELQVRIIRKSYVKHNSHGVAINNQFGLSAQKLGDVFGVYGSSILKIIHKRVWKHI